MEIKQVTVTTDRGDCFVTVNESPSYLSVSFSRELIEHADQDLLASVVARALKMAIVA